MYNNTLQLNWKVGHGLPLTSVASSLNTSPTTSNGANMSQTSALTNVMSSINRQSSMEVTKKVNKKMSGKRSIGSTNSENKNLRVVNNTSRAGNTATIPGNVTLSEKTSTGKKNKNKSYTLRACSIQKRLETEHRTKLPRKRGPKPRPKTAPMSKYRRKTANLRERQRMGEINVAFEILREKLPSPISLKNGGKCEKLTKINILHIAINYIRAMENLLETGDSGVNSFKEMVKNPIRDDQDRKMEVQKVLEALMKRADNISSSSNPNGGLKRLTTTRSGGTNRNKVSDAGGGKRKNGNKNRKIANERLGSLANGVLKNRSENNENFDSSKAMSFLMSTLNSMQNDQDTDREKDDSKSSTSDSDDEDLNPSGLPFENMTMLPEWSELSSTLDISSMGSEGRIDLSNSSSSLPNIFMSEEGKEPKFTDFVDSNSSVTCTNSNQTASVINSSTSTRFDIKPPSSNSLLLELMPIPQNNIKKQQDMLAIPSQSLPSKNFQNILQLNRNTVVNQGAVVTNFASTPSSVVSMSPNSSNCSLSSNSSLSSTINSPISPSISLFKEPDPVFASIVLDKTPKFDGKSSDQMIQGSAIHQMNQQVKLETRSIDNSSLSYSSSINPSFQNNDEQQQPQHQLVSNHSGGIKENNNHLFSGSVIECSNGDDIMMRDFTDFVEMVDSLNGMPDIEFVEDNFEIFPS